MDIDALIDLYPRLYHMAEPNSWQSIQRYGLLSTHALLNLFEINDPLRHHLESEHRPEKVPLTHPRHNRVVLRDQKPMTDDRLVQALNGSATPTEWYTLLNSFVFFWGTRERLSTLLNARAYKNDVHDVLTINSRQLILDYADRISLCHMNSGNTFPIPHARTPEIFKSIADYPANPRTRKPINKVAELVVRNGVTNIQDYVIKVDQMRGDDILANIYP